MSHVQQYMKNLGITLEGDERVDALCAGRWIIQRTRGHRATSDDQLLAWSLHRVWRSMLPPSQVLELGAGKGTVTLILSALWPDAKFVGVEAFASSYQLSIKNQILNDLEHRFKPQLGDLRDPQLIEHILSRYGMFDVVCGAPPFMPVGSGIMPQDEQRASGRFEIRGGLESYLEALSCCLKPHHESRGVLLMDGESAIRSRQAIRDRPELILLSVTTVCPRPEAPPTYEIFELAKRDAYRSAYIGELKDPILERLDLRTREGEHWSQDYQSIRSTLGFGKLMSPLIFIPVRLASSRLSEKALADLKGAPLITRVIENLLQGFKQERLIIASDDERILEASKHTNPPSESASRLMIDTPCHSGSQRVLRAFEVVASRPFLKEEIPWIINVQGDEPMLPIESLYALIESLAHFERRGIKIVTLAAPLPLPISDAHQDRSLVKVCLAELSPSINIVPVHSEVEFWRRALFFTREATGTHQHIGVYAFHHDVLKLIDHPRGKLATHEDLEQLTWLEQGEEIGVVCLRHSHPKGIDTQADLDEARKTFSTLKHRRQSCGER